MVCVQETSCFPEYSITVVTADKRFAGTDANVFITLFGKKGVSKKIPLKNKSKNNFERGQTDTFYSGIMEDIGPITRIKSVPLKQSPTVPLSACIRTVAIITSHNMLSKNYNLKVYFQDRARRLITWSWLALRASESICSVAAQLKPPYTNPHIKLDEQVHRDE